MKHRNQRNPDVTASLVTGSSSNARAKVAEKLPHIDGYVINSVLGQGGMGTVYQAIQTKLNRPVALKVLHAVIATASPNAVSRFQREASAAARLHHTNIVPIYDYGESADGYYYAMELIVGQPLETLIRRLIADNAASATPARLAELLRAHLSGACVDDESAVVPDSSGSRDSSASKSSGLRGNVYFDQVARWITSAADGLDYAHKEGIVHRDIKPGNLLLSLAGRIMIADFGLAKTASDASITLTGSLLGTLRYMSPEQAMARRVRIDHRTDVYSLGATMYELLCFHPVYAGSDEKEIMGLIISRDPTAPRKIHAHVPAELETICLKCLEKAPSDRYSSAKELADDLRRYMNDIPLVAKRPGALRRTHKFLRRHRLEVTAISAAALLIVATVILARERTHRQKEVVARLQQEVNALYESGFYFATQGMWENATEELDRALKRDGKNVKILVGAAWVRLEQQRATPDLAGSAALEEAESLCQRALQIEPNHVEALSFLGVALRRLGRFDEAVAVMQRAVKLDGTQFAALSNLGALYAMMEDFENAHRYIQQGAERAGHKRDEYRAAAWRNLASLEQYQKNPDALAHIDIATECYRDDSSNWLVRARTLLTVSGVMDVDSALNAAVHADFLAGEEHGRTKRIRALAHLRNGEFDESVTQASLAIERGDLPTPNHLIIAIAEGKRGNLNLARESLGSAKATWPVRLSEPGNTWATVDGGNLWIESAEEMLALRVEAEKQFGKTAADSEIPIQGR